MYIQRNKAISKSGKEYSSVLLCSKYREGGKIKTRTITNLSKLPEHVILGIENMLKSDKETTIRLQDIAVSRCSDYGYAYVILEIMRQLRIEETLEKVLSPSDATLVKAMIIGKIITNGSKLGIYNWLCREESVCEMLGVNMSEYTVNDLYASLNQLYSHHTKIEKKWFRYHKGVQRRVYLYDISSSYFEGTQNELGAFGYNRDRKKGKMQLGYGLLTSDDGFPFRIQAFEGNTSDSTTVSEQILRLKKEFGVDQVIFVGDRGMQILYHLEKDPELSNEHIDFITGLTRFQIETLVAQGDIDMNLFSSDLAEVSVDEMRYVLSVNPDLEARERYYLNIKRKRADGLLENIRNPWHKRCVRNRENLQKQQENAKKYKQLKTELTVKDIDGYKRRVTLALAECGMSKYYSIEAIDNEDFRIEFKQSEYDKSLSLCGKYVVCTNVSVSELTTEQVRGQYKNLQHVEHAFRDMKSDNIGIRPIYHRKEVATRGHVLLCMFAYAILKGMENSFFPFLKDYNHLQKRMLSFDDLTAELKNVKMCELHVGRAVKTVQIPDLNELQKKIFDVLKIDPKKMTERYNIQK